MADTNATFWQKYRDPRWQKKRLEVMEREEFACEMCGDTESTLNVHHGFYRKNCDPWDYPSDSLHCLCEGCHDVAEDFRHDAALQLARVPPLFYNEFFAFLVDGWERHLQGIVGAKQSA